ncbi:MAG: molybdopterin-dependent oxidoreductase [Nitrososphaerota archaeon]
MSRNLLSRRDFLKSSLVLGTAFVFSDIPFKETLLREISREEAEKLKAEAQQTKTTFATLSLCGFGSAQQIAAFDVKNGRIIRIRPLHFDWQYSLEELNYDAAKIEVGGKVFQAPLRSLLGYLAQGYKKRIYSPNRVKYPLKRVDWSPERPNSQNRGKSGFVRISWEEAINILVSEIKRISEKYGPSAILTQSEGHSQSKSLHGAAHFWVDHLSKFMGFTRQTRNPDSWEGWWYGAKHVWGMEMGVGLCDYQQNNLLDTLENSELLLFWGGDLETTPHGFAGQISSVYHFWWRDAGKKCVYICPDGNYANVIHADKWIPVLPNTDVALHLAIAYVWITEGTYDKKYVETHTFGFEHFRKYVLGEEDGVPKTPKWAEQICGVPARTIKALARTWAKKKTSIFHCNGGPTIRGPYSTEPGRTEIYLLAMQGIGKPGVQQIKMHEWGLFVGWPFANPKVMPTTGAGTRGIFGIVATKPFILKTLTPEGILATPDKPIEWYGAALAIAPVEEQFNKYQFPPEGYPDIHMIWSETPCWSVCWNGGNALVRAFRHPKVEFYVVQHITLEDDALFADLILPVTTTFENDIDIMADVGNGQYALIYIQRQCINPIGESKSDVEIIEEVAKRLGFDFTQGKSHEEWARIAFENSGVAEFISWEEFLEKQYFVVPTDPKWKEIKPGMRWYWELPEGKDLHTKSGKIEFFAQWLYEHFGNDPERPPVAHYIPYGKTWQESRFHPKAQKYPLLVVSNHPRWREHANQDDSKWLMEISTHKMWVDGYPYQPMWIHPIDAAKRGIKHGDIVKVYNDRGAILCAAYVTERIMPGAISIDHGARLDPLELGERGIELDRGGSINLICPKEDAPHIPLMVVSGFLVEVERVDLEELKKRYPEAFARRLHPDIGPYLDTWLVG